MRRRPAKNSYFTPGFACSINLFPPFFFSFFLSSSAIFYLHTRAPPPPPPTRGLWPECCFHATRRSRFAKAELFSSPNGKFREIADGVWFRAFVLSRWVFAGFALNWRGVLVWIGWFCQESFWAALSFFFFCGIKREKQSCSSELSINSWNWLTCKFEDIREVHSLDLFCWK